MGSFGNGRELYQYKDYYRYIDDYETELVEDEKGRYRKKVTYVGPLIRITGDIPSARRIFLLTDLLSVLVMGALLTAAFVRHTTGGWLLTVLPLMISLFTGAWLVMGAFALPLSGKPMRRDRYMHSMIRCFRSCGAVLVLMAVLIASELLYRGRNGDWMFLRGDFCFLGCIFAAAAMAFGIIRLLRLVPVDERELVEFDQKRGGTK
ncbi:MAG: hypothetical protein IKS07_08600 [Lachnospiraceae bacterium]|nr:hypothetical protein [Lachnospiraceae bacterium]